MGRWYPGLLFGLLVDHACFNIPVKGKLDALQVFFAGEAIGIKDFVVIRAQLDGVRALDVTDKVLILVLLEGVRHGLGQDGHEGCADLVRALLTILDDVSDLDRRAAPHIPLSGRSRLAKHFHSDRPGGGNCHRFAQRIIPA